MVFNSQTTLTDTECVLMNDGRRREERRGERRRGGGRGGDEEGTEKKGERSREEDEDHRNGKEVNIWGLCYFCLYLPHHRIRLYIR